LLKANIILIFVTVKARGFKSFDIMKQLTDGVWEYSLINPEGFTLNIETMKPIKYGLSVAYQDTQDSFGKESLNKVINHALEHGRSVGGWFDTESKRYYFDSVKIFKNSEIDKAIEFAKNNNQLAIYDLTNLKEIRIK
jgi:fructokinase